MLLLTCRGWRAFLAHGSQLLEHPNGTISHPLCWLEAPEPTEFQENVSVAFNHVAFIHGWWRCRYYMNISVVVVLVLNYDLELNFLNGTWFRIQYTCLCIEFRRNRFSVLLTLIPHVSISFLRIFHLKSILKQSLNSSLRCNQWHSKMRTSNSIKKNHFLGFITRL